MRLGAVLIALLGCAAAVLGLATNVTDGVSERGRAPDQSALCRQRPGGGRGSWACCPPAPHGRHVPPPNRSPRHAPPALVLACSRLRTPRGPARRAPGRLRYRSGRQGGVQQSLNMPSPSRLPRPCLPPLLQGSQGRRMLQTGNFYRPIGGRGARPALCERCSQAGRPLRAPAPLVPASTMLAAVARAALGAAHEP